MKSNHELQRTFNADKMIATYQSRSVGKGIEYIFFSSGDHRFCYTLKDGFTWRNTHDVVAVVHGEFTMFESRNFISETFAGHPYVADMPINHTIESEA